MAFQTVRGTFDLLPAKIRQWREVEQRAMRVADLYGFQEIRTPMFEKADLFIKGLGVMAGLVEKELWTFHDKHGQKLALKADLTASVARAYHQHTLGQQYPNVARLFYISPVFLVGKDGEQPSRQAHQFGLEVLGSDSPAVDVELLSLAIDLCRDLNIPDVQIELNTLGCDRCQPAYHDALREFFSGRQAELCNTCKRKYRAHPTWTLSCPEATCKALANLAPTMLGYLCQDCKTHFNAIKHFVHDLNLGVTFNPSVVRDLEYYDRTVFRVTAGGRVIGSGGRYNGLVEQLGGPATPAAGFALNLDEVMELLDEQEAELEGLDAIFMPEGEEATKVLLPMMQKLRTLGARVDMYYKALKEFPPHRCLIRLAEANAFRGQAELFHANAENGEQIYPDKLLNRLQYLLDLGGGDSGGGQNRNGNSRRRLQRSRGGDLRQRMSTPAPRREESPANESMEDAVEAVQEEGSGRRRRRRRRRGEDREEQREVRAAAPAPEPEAEEEVVEERPARGRRQERGRREEAPREEARREEPRRSESRRDEPRREEGRREEGRSRREESRPEEPRREREREERPAARPPAQADTGKAFIPAMIFGGAPARGEDKPAAPKKPREAAAASVKTVTENAGPGLGLNWSVGGKGKVSEGADADMDEGDEPELVGSSSSTSRRRSRRRR